MSEHRAMENYDRLQALFRYVRQHFCGGSSAELARRIGRSDSYVNRLFYPKEKNGSKGIGPEIMQACSEAFALPRGFWEMTLEEVAGDAAFHWTALSARHEHNVTIPQFEIDGRVGGGLVLHDQPGEIHRWVVSPDWIQKNVHRITSPSNLAIVTGFGDSMKGVFNPGDPLIIDKGVTRADIDGIYFFRIGQEGFVKRLQRIPTLNGIVLRAKSENTSYDPFDIVEGMDFEILGRVVKIWESEDF